MRISRGLHRLVEALPRPPLATGAPFLSTWRLAGPFAPSGDPGPSAAAAMEPGPWQDFDERTVNRAYDDFNDLHLWLRMRDGHAPPSGSIVYLELWIHSRGHTDAQLRLGACGPLAAWCDAEPLMALEGWTLRRDARRAPMPLASGWHRLQLRAEHVGGPWGFYARLTGAFGRPLDTVTTALGRPGPLTVGTWALPRGHVGWPYVGLDNRRGEPRASPFTLTAGGGQPPYRWAIARGKLPAGIALCPSTGALTGTPATAGSAEVVVEAQDAAGARTRRTLTVTVEKPPTAWHDEGPLGVFVHFDKPAAVDVGVWDRGMAEHPGYAEHWASLAQRAGASVLVLTAKHHDSWANWPTEVRRSDGVPAQRTGTDTLSEASQAVRQRGMRFGIYFSTLDTWHPGYRDDVPSYLRFQFRQLEELVERYRPSMVWLDGHWDKPGRDWGYDPLLSLVHGLVPEAVIANNPGRRTLNVGDSGYGDVDVRTFESHGYWGHMPRRQRQRRNPRPLPAQKFSFTCNWWSPGEDPRWLGCDKNNCWREWVRVLSRMVAGGGTLLLGVGPGYPGAPPGSPPPGELYPGAAQVLEGVGAWLNSGRAEAFVAVRPGPLAGGVWGRCVHRDGRLYLHLPPGPAAGWPSARLRLAPLPAGLEVIDARRLPDGVRVPFTQSGAAVTLELAAVAADPVLSLVALDVRESGSRIGDL